MEVIGLYAGVAGGKSTIAKLFAELGAVVLNADATVHELYAEPHVHEILTAILGEDVIRAGEVDKRVIADRIFQNPALRKQLEEAIHPLVSARTRERIEQHQRENDVPACVLDVPLLLGSRVEPLCTRRVFVDTPFEQRLARAQAQRGWDETELRRREAAQPSEADKRARTEAVIDNSRDLDDARRQVRELWQAWDLPLPTDGAAP